MNPYETFAEEVCCNCKAEECHRRNSSNTLYRYDCGTMS